MIAMKHTQDAHIIGSEMERILLAVCYLMDHVANKYEVPLFTSKMKDLPSCLYFFLKNSILQRETFSLAFFCLDIAQEVGYVKEKDRRPHNPFQVEGVTVFRPNTFMPTAIAAVETAIHNPTSSQNCDMPITCNRSTCARCSISFSQLCLPVFSHSAVDTCLDSHYKSGISLYSA